MAWRIGVDSGGTFTDICLFDDEAGRVEIWKVPSTTNDPSEAIANGSEEAIGRVGSTLSDLGYFGHGTTVGTNALIQHKGVRTGLITTEGFRDLLEIARQRRTDLYDLQEDKPPTLVSRDLRLGVTERVKFDGSIETAFDAEGFRAAVKKLKEEKVAAVAVCFLYSFLQPKHEAMAADILNEEFPEAFHSVSHLVAPEFREYERLSTTVVNAYLGPIMRDYINRLAERLSQKGMVTAPHLTQSNGGVIGFGSAAQLPVRTVLSGPSTGVVAAGKLGLLSGFPDLITFDMGGTSTDVALLEGGECRTTAEAVVHGYPIKAPMLDIHTVGAGGGSIAFIDNGGLLKVGPASAGAVPGPVCYDKGNLKPTVTDANVVLQTLNPTHLLGGRMPIRRDLALKAIEAMAGELGLDTMATAQGIISIVTANMAKAIRVISIQRGYDPREYALMAFGGAGPLHSARLAKELEMKRVIVPPHPGIMCATGLLLTDLRADFAATLVKAVDASEIEAMTSIYADLARDAEQWFEAEHIAPGARKIHRTVDMRYVGQNYELGVAVPDGPITQETLDVLIAEFEKSHERIYGFTSKGEPIRLITYRVEAVGEVPKAEFKSQPLEPASMEEALIGRRDVWMPESGGFTSCPIYDRWKIKPGTAFEGPAIVEQMDATTVVLPDMTVRVDQNLSLIMEFK